MKANELTKLPAQELKQKLESLKEEQFSLKLKQSMGQQPDALKLRYLRKDVARRKTLERQRELGIASASTSSTAKRRSKESV